MTDEVVFTESGFNLGTKKTKSGWVISPAYYRQHPERTEEWASVERKSYNDDDWQREMEIDFHKTSEKRVYKFFDTKIHCAELQYNKSFPILRGWDFGLTEACIFTQWDNDKKILYVLGELIEEDSKIYTFKTNVIEYCRERWPDALFQDYCDISGTFQSEKAAKTDVEVLCDYNVGGVGIYPMSRKADVHRGLTAVRELLDVRKNGKPGLIIDKDNCPILIRGFCGEYVLNKKLKPKVDQHPIDDPQDALRYVLDNYTGIIARHESDDIDEEEEELARGWETSDVSGYRR